VVTSVVLGDLGLALLTVLVRVAGDERVLSMREDEPAGARSVPEESVMPVFDPLVGELPMLPWSSSLSCLTNEFWDPRCLTGVKMGETTVRRVVGARQAANKSRFRFWKVGVCYKTS